MLVQELALNFWYLLLESAPWLLMGYVIAGIINVMVPKQWINKYLGGEGPSYIVKAALIGAPLPLCSCGVIPAAMGIHRAGASKGATASFLVATPETGVDSISLSYALMGPIMAIARPVSAIVSAIVSGLSVSFLSRSESSISPSEAPQKTSCCHKKNQPEQIAAPSFLVKLKSAIYYGLYTMLKDTLKWLALGLLGAAIIKTWVPDSFFTQWGDGLLAMLVMVVAGLPMYICASASTPLGAGLMFAGVSPGAALVFMLTGPATNIATLGVIKQELGSRSLFGYLFGVIVTAIIMGLSFNWAIQYWGLSIIPVELTHQHSSYWLGYLSVAILSLAILNMLYKRLMTVAR